DASQPEERRGAVVKRDPASCPLRVVDPAAVLDEGPVVLAKGGQRVAEIDRDLGCGGTSRLKVAIARDRTGRVAREDLVRRVHLVRDRICRSAGDDEEEQPTHRSEDAPARCGAPTWNART